MTNDEAVRKVMEMAEQVRARLGEPMQGYATKHNGKVVSEAEARARFRQRYGHDPDRCVQVGPIWLAGPVKQQEEQA